MNGTGQDTRRTTRPQKGPGRVPPRPPGERRPPLPMDPRIRQRRIEIRRDKGRQRLRVLVACAAVVAAVGSAAALARSPLFDVDYVDVRGIDQTSRRAVLRAGGLDGRPALVDVDEGAVARRVEALPWVLEATVQRDWPGTVRIDVRERRPAAVLPAGPGRWAVADGSGRILAAGPEKPAGLPVLGNVAAPGPPGSALPRSALPSLRVAASLPETLRARVADVASVAGGEVELQLVPPGGVVRLGPPVGLGVKLAVLETLLARAELSGVAVMDLRVPRAPALTRR